MSGVCEASALLSERVERRHSTPNHPTRRVEIHYEIAPLTFDEDYLAGVGPVGVGDRGHGDMLM